MTLKNKLLCAFGFGLSILSLTVSAAPESIKLARTIPYVDGAANDAIRSECHFPTDLSQAIADSSTGNGLDVQLTDENLEQASGRVLRIRTEYIDARGGGSYTGKKSARIRGELRDNGQVIGDFQMERATGGGLFGFTACSALQRLSGALGKDVAKWLKKPVPGTRQGIR